MAAIQKGSLKSSLMIREDSEILLPEIVKREQMQQVII
jgi:hypothetical protein